MPEAQRDRLPERRSAFADPVFVPVDTAAAFDAVWRSMTESFRPEADTGREQPPKRSREPLHLRMYFQQHLTELVRLFGYHDVPLDEAREALKPLNETYGLDAMKAAVEEIIHIDGASDPPVARLTDHARKLAVGILGSRKSPETADTSTPEAAPIPRPSPTSRENKRRRKQANSGAASDVASVSSTPTYEGPVQLRRKAVLVAFEEWLKGTKQPFVGIDTAGQNIGTLNFILQTEPLQRLVTVHHQVTKRQAREMREWHQKYGQQFEPFSVWPHEGPGGWEWIFTPIPQ